MFVLLLIGALGLVVILAAVMMSPQKMNDEFGCEDDIPCQECGRCYGDHITAKMSNTHAYAYPRDLHR